MSRAPAAVMMRALCPASVERFFGRRSFREDQITLRANQTGKEIRKKNDGITLVITPGHTHLMLANLLKAAIVAELGAVAGGYYVFHRLNTDVEFRAWAGDTCPSCLDGFCIAVSSLGYALPPDLVAFRARMVKGGEGGEGVK